MDLCVVPVKVVGQQAVALLDQTVPGQQLLIGLPLVPHMEGRSCLGVHDGSEWMDQSQGLSMDRSQELSVDRSQELSVDRSHLLGGAGGMTSGVGQCHLLGEHEDGGDTHELTHELK